MRAIFNPNKLFMEDIQSRGTFSQIYSWQMKGYQYSSRGIDHQGLYLLSFHG